MRRRDLLAGTAALAAMGVGGAYAFGAVDGRDRAGIEPFDLETIDAPGSDAGTITVPERGRVTYLELFATWCDVCARTMPAKGEVYDEFADRELQFVSVTNEPIGNTVTRADVADWWTSHDGRWPVAIDADLELTETLEATGVPYGFVLDSTNVVVWSNYGDTDVTELREVLEASLPD